MLFVLFILYIVYFVNIDKIIGVFIAIFTSQNPIKSYSYISINYNYRPNCVPLSKELVFPIY